MAKSTTRRGRRKTGMTKREAADLMNQPLEADLLSSKEMTAINRVAQIAARNEIKRKKRQLKKRAMVATRLMGS